MTDTNMVLAEMHQVLDDERMAIRVGDFGKLPDLIVRKERLLAAAHGMDARALDRLRGRLEHNQTLLESAMNGLRVAGQRVDQIMAVTRQCTTYDRNGQAQHIVNTNAALERRA